MNIAEWFRRHYVLVLVLIFLAVVNVFFYFVNPDVIVDYVGVKSSYTITFVIATIGGLSTFTGPVLFTTIATFAGGGSNPLLLGIIGGMGIFISDSIFFHLTQLGYKHVPENWEKWLDRIKIFMQKYPRWLLLVFVYLYISFTPLPNDILMLALVFGGYLYRQVVFVLLAGSLSIALVTAYLGVLWL